MGTLGNILKKLKKILDTRYFHAIYYKHELKTGTEMSTKLAKQFSITTPAAVDYRHEWDNTLAAFGGAGI